MTDRLSKADYETLAEFRYRLRRFLRFSEEAADYAEGRLLDRNVRLAFGPELRDYYGRLLAYVFLDDGTCFNLAIVSDGYGFAYLKYPFPFQDEFSAAEREARSAGRGLWAP